MTQRINSSNQCFLSQLGNRNEEPENGARALWYAVLERAILDISGNYSGCKPTAKQLEKNYVWCLHWQEDDADTVASFPWVCQFLDIDPYKIKNLIQNVLYSEKKLVNNHFKATNIESHSSDYAVMSFIIDLKAA